MLCPLQETRSPHLDLRVVPARVLEISQFILFQLAQLRACLSAYSSFVVPFVLFATNCLLFIEHVFMSHCYTILQPRR